MSSDVSSAEDISKEATIIENEKNSMKIQSNLDLLMDLYSTNENHLSGPVMTLTPLVNNTNVTDKSNFQIINPNFISNENIELLNRITGNGLQITYKYTRTPHLFSNNLVNIALTFYNSNNEVINDIRIGQKVSYLTLEYFCSLFYSFTEFVTWNEY